MQRGGLIHVFHINVVRGRARDVALAPISMRLEDARDTLRRHGMTLSRDRGRYHVTYADGGPEDAAYYTNDLQDAVAAGIHMRQRRDAARPTKQSFA